jgi:hypothetical protein
VWFREATRFIEANRIQPFFVYLPTNAPHGPHHVPWRYAEPLVRDGRVDEKAARFFGMIANIDENVGRLRRRLVELDLADNTLVIFVTDNGGTAGTRLYNSGMRAGKGSAYEGGHRAACFLYWPAGGLIGGRDVSPITAHFDLLPTLVDLCRIAEPQGVALDGMSLAGLLRGDEQDGPKRTLLVHHQGRFGQKILDDRPIKYKDYAVMRGRWRLVGKELYDIQADPAQRKDVAADHPEVVRELSVAYESWWNDISQRFDEYCPTVVGSQTQPRTVLTCQDWHGEVIPYNQQHVRAGVVANGYWSLDVAEAGTYEIRLRRWPAELELPIQAELSADELDPRKYDALFKLNQLPSRAIQATEARLRVGAFDETVAVDDGDKCIVFRVTLPAGPVRLQTWLTDAAGTSWGAYYVEIEESAQRPCETRHEPIPPR